MRAIIFLFLICIISNANAQEWAMTNDGGWDYVFGAADGNGLLVGKVNGNTITNSDRAHILYRNPDGGIYYGYNGSGSIVTTINSQANGNSYFNSGGRVGIGTPTPTYMLDVAAAHATVQFRLQRTASSQGVSDLGSDNEGLKFWPGGYSGDPKVVFAANGNVGIGTSSYAGIDSKLTVAGNIHSREVKVTVSAGADFVFKKEYKLSPLSEVEAYVKKNNHLPGVESAEEMETNGLLLGKMDIKLLQKVEELTLYIIELDKSVKALQKENERLQAELSKK